MTLSPTPPAPSTTKCAPGGTFAAFSTAPTPVTTAQPSVASTSNGRSPGTRTAPPSATTTKSAKQAVPRNAATGSPPACRRVAPDGSRLRYVLVSSRSHNTATPATHDGHAPHAGAQHK